MAGVSVLYDKQYPVSLNDHIANYIKADESFMAGIHRGIEALNNGEVRPWKEIKKELKL